MVLKLSVHNLLVHCSSVLQSLQSHNGYCTDSQTDSSSMYIAISKDELLGSYHSSEQLVFRYKEIVLCIDKHRVLLDKTVLLWVQFDSLFQSNNLFLADATYHSHSYCVCHQNSSLGFNCMLGVIEIPQFVPSIRQLVLYVILPPSVCATKGHLL